MFKLSIAIEAPPELMKEIVKIATIEGVDLSKPVSVESPADPLDAPFSAEEIKHFLEIVTIVFKSGAAGLGFVTALRGILGKHDGESLSVRDPISGKERGRINSESSEEDAKRVIGL